MVDEVAYRPLVCFKVAHELNMCLVCVCVCVETKKDKHETFFLLLLDKRCMTSVMKVCGIILLYYSPYTSMIDVSVL